MLLVNYLKKMGIPNRDINAQGHVCRPFFKKNILTFWDAIEYVHQLPYGRTRNREIYLQVLEDGKGVCSNKHALIAALAEELGIPLQLYMGIYFMTSKNTPQITPILEHYHLEAIPEAHCYLRHDDYSLDITFPNSTVFSLNVDLEREMTITPQQIGLFKVEKHKAFIKSWIKDRPDLSTDFIWNAREEWIEKLILS